MSETDYTEFKNKWLPSGLPETLLDEMIAEAEAEYDSELQYADVNRYKQLNIIIEDIPLQSGEFYLYFVQRANEIFQGVANQLTEWLFAGIPCVEIVAQVFKMKYDGVLSVIGFGYNIFNHTKDESVTVSIDALITRFAIGVCDGIPITDELDMTICNDSETLLSESLSLDIAIT